ncbi:hypothetical protein ABLE86_19510 [Mesorhizobium sp. KR2-14]
MREVGQAPMALRAADTPGAILKCDQPTRQQRSEMFSRAGRGDSEFLRYRGRGLLAAKFQEPQDAVIAWGTVWHDASFD